MSMKVGTIVRTRRLECYFEGARVRGSASYRAAPGKKFVLVVMGVEADGAPEAERVDPEAVLRAMGWVPDPDLAEEIAPEGAEADDEAELTRLAFQPPSAPAGGAG